MRNVIKKVALKNTLYFVKYKKDKFLTVNSSTVRHFISLLSRNLSFLYFLKYFLTGLFCVHSSCLNLYTYLITYFFKTKKCEVLKNFKKPK
jgi:hypothetical protein